MYAFSLKQTSKYLIKSWKPFLARKSTLLLYFYGSLFRQAYKSFALLIVTLSTDMLLSKSFLLLNIYIS